MTPNRQSCSHSLIFSTVQKDDMMSKRLAHPTTESATATQRPVRKKMCSESLLIEFVIKLCQLLAKPGRERSRPSCEQRGFQSSFSHVNHPREFHRFSCDVVMRSIFWDLNKFSDAIVFPSSCCLWMFFPLSATESLNTCTFDVN